MESVFVCGTRQYAIGISGKLLDRELKGGWVEVKKA